MLRWALDRRAVLKLGGAGAAAAILDRARLGAAPARAATLPSEPRERRLANLRQLTFGGQNAEAYWNASGSRLIFQSTRPPFGCDQIFTMHADGSDVRLVSTGKGRTTCAFFFPDGRRVIYASTHVTDPACPPPPDRSRLRLADLSELRDLRGGARRRFSRDSPTTRATTPRAPSPPTAARSSSHRSARATSTST